MTDSTIAQELKEIKAMLTALTTGLEAHSMEQTTNMARLLSEFKKLAPQPRSRPATAAAAKPAAPKLPRTFKAWFIAQYKEAESTRDKCKDMIPTIHKKTSYVNAKEENKIAKEAELAFEELSANTTYAELHEELEKEFQSLRTTQMKEAGIEPVAAAAAAAAPASDDAEDAAAPAPAAKKPLTKKPAPKKGAVPKEIDG